MTIETQKQEHSEVGRRAASDVEPIVMMPSARKNPLIEFFYSEGAPPFICGVTGFANISMLEEMENAMQEEHETSFPNGEGIYLFEARFNPAQTGDKGRIELAEYWEFEPICFEPIDA